MTTVSIKVLLIEDNPGDAKQIASMRADAGAKGLAFELTWAEDRPTGTRSGAARPKRRCGPRSANAGNCKCS